MTHDTCSVPPTMLVEQRVFLEPGQAVTVYGEVASSEGLRPALGLVLADSITIHPIEARPRLKWRRLSFRHLR